LDKKVEQVRGVPNEYVGNIDGIRDILLKAVEGNSSLPEPHYYLARYYNYFDSPREEQITLEHAIRAFDVAPEESVRRLKMRIDAERRYAHLLTRQKASFQAEEQLIKGINIYEDALTRKLLSPAPEFGRLYGDLGDITYFLHKDDRYGNMATALDYYKKAEQNGWMPPETEYRMGAAHYFLEQWGPAFERFVHAASNLPYNRRLLNALGNAAYMRGDFFIAQGYYNRLLNLLENERARFPVLRPSERPDHLELAQRLMVVMNNLGVTAEALTQRTGNNEYRSNALGFYAESARAWDSLTRNPATMIRAGSADLSHPGINLPYINSQNVLHPETNYQPQVFLQIDKDVLEPSPWEELAPEAFRLTDRLFE
jgi:hypothetical protein